MRFVVMLVATALMDKIVHPKHGWAEVLYTGTKIAFWYFVLIGVLSGAYAGPWDTCDELGRVIHEAMDEHHRLEYEARIRMGDRSWAPDSDELVKSILGGAAAGALTKTKEGVLIGGAAGGLGRLVGEYYDKIKDELKDMEEVRHHRKEQDRLQEELNNCPR